VGIVDDFRAFGICYYVGMKKRQIVFLLILSFLVAGICAGLVLKHVKDNGNDSVLPKCPNNSYAVFGGDVKCAQ